MVAKMDGIPGGLEGCLSDIETGAEKLCSALLARNTETIMASVTLLEDSMERLTNETRKAGTDTVSLKPLIERTRSLLRVNRIISRTFLEVIERTMESVSHGTHAGRERMYNEDGRVTRMAPPILIQFQG